MATVLRALKAAGAGSAPRKSPGKELWTIYRLVHGGTKMRGSQQHFTHPPTRAEVEEFLARFKAGEDQLTADRHLALFLPVCFGYVRSSFLGGGDATADGYGRDGTR